MISMINVTTAKFPLGQVVMTPGVRDSLGSHAICTALNRHSQGDWGDVPKADAEENELSLKEGFRLLSSYEADGVRFWIITEADRSATTVLLPEEY